MTGSITAVVTTVVVSLVFVTQAYFSEQAAHQTAEHRRQETLRWLDVAHDSLGSAYLHLGEVFSLFPSMKAAYAGFLTQGASQYEQLAAVASDDPDLEAERARVLLILGDIRLELGENKLADAAYRSAMTILQKIDKTAARVPVDVEVANCQVRLASLAVRSKDASAATVLLNQSILSLSQSSEIAPDDSYILYSLASALLNYGSLQIEADRSEAASQPLREAVRHFQKLVTDAPSDGDFLTGLVKSMTLLGK